jgi:iron(III) transport system substrate-binding protein
VKRESDESLRVWWVESLIVVALGALFTGLWLSGRQGRPESLVVYCAHDAIYAQQVLAAFESRTGIAVTPVFDTEATKSLGLVEKIAAERRRPRCDVFWNNEQLGTMHLADEGLLEPYKGEGYERIPAAYKDPQGRWTGFAARMRVWIINTNAMEPTREAIDALLASPDLSRVAIAKPLFGTTRTHYTVLWDVWGPPRVQEWHHDWRSRRVVEASGNAMVKNLVAAGTCYLGLTDTDDFFLAKDAGRPVAMLPVRVENPKADEDAPMGWSVVIPNTVAIVKGTRRIEQARQLVEYLLSAETELALAASPSRQIPLNEHLDLSLLSGEVRRLVGASVRPYPLSGLGEAGRQCLQWLREEYLR